LPTPSWSVFDRDPLALGRLVWVVGTPASRELHAVVRVRDELGGVVANHQPVPLAGDANRMSKWALLAAHPARSFTSFIDG
jgi:hypothetical protein